MVDCCVFSWFVVVSRSEFKLSGRSNRARVSKEYGFPGSGLSLSHSLVVSRGDCMAPSRSGRSNRAKASKEYFRRIQCNSCSSRRRDCDFVRLKLMSSHLVHGNANVQFHFITISFSFVWVMLTKGLRAPAIGRAHNGRPGRNQVVPRAPKNSHLCIFGCEKATKIG